MSYSTSYFNWDAPDTNKQIIGNNNYKLFYKIKYNYNYN